VKSEDQLASSRLRLDAIIAFFVALFIQFPADFTGYAPVGWLLWIAATGQAGQYGGVFGLFLLLALIVLAVYWAVIFVMIRGLRSLWRKLARN